MNGPRDGNTGSARTGRSVTDVVAGGGGGEKRRPHYFAVHVSCAPSNTCSRATTHLARATRISRWCPSTRPAPLVRPWPPVGRARRPRTARSTCRPSPGPRTPCARHRPSRPGIPSRSSSCNTKPRTGYGQLNTVCAGATRSARSVFKGTARGDEFRMRGKIALGIDLIFIFFFLCTLTADQHKFLSEDSISNYERSRLIVNGIGIMFSLCSFSVYENTEKVIHFNRNVFVKPYHDEKMYYLRTKLIMNPVLTIQGIPRRRFRVTWCKYNGRGTPFMFIT